MERRKNIKPVKKERVREEPKRVEEIKHIPEAFESDKPIEINFSQPVSFNIGGLNKRN
jgi:hypothetical protein